MNKPGNGSFFFLGDVNLQRNKGNAKGRRY